METTSYDECMFDFVEVEMIKHLFSIVWLFYVISKIRDGDNENSTLVGKYCTDIPPPFQSTFNYLWIKFESDSSVSAQGFQANYTITNIGELKLKL